MEKAKDPKRLNDIYALFYQALLKGGVKNIVQTANLIFNKPVLFTDENYRLICQSPEEPIGNYIWDTLYEKKTLSIETIWEYQHFFLNDQVNTYEPFYANWGVVKDAPRIFGEVAASDQVLGHVAIFLMDKPLAEDDLEIAQIFIDTLNIGLIKNKNEYGGQSFSRYLEDLLDPAVSPSLQLLAIDQLHKKFLSNYVLLVTPIGKKASQHAFASFVITELANWYQNFAFVLHENCIVTLIGGLDSTQSDVTGDPFIKKITDFFYAHELVSGCCDCFSDLHELHIRYRQALLTAQLTNSSKKKAALGTYQEYVPLQMFHSLAKIDVSEVYVHPVLKKIDRYDQENKTDYFKTLQIYSLCIHDRDLAATRLSIHRNTLHYRLNRIGDLFDLDYDDPQTAAHLLCSFLFTEVDHQGIKF